MSEEKAVSRSTSLITAETLRKDLESLGVREGMTLIVHSSLSSIGWVCGAEQAVIQALLSAVGEQGTIVMPSQSLGNSDPKYWQNPAVPEEWWDGIRKGMPAYDPTTTPTRGMGRVAELFRTFPDARRSGHPTVSFSAIGRLAEEMTQTHSTDLPFGEESPLAKLYDSGSMVLLIGVGYDNSTSMHLGEYRAGGLKTYKQSSAMMEGGKRIWKTYTEAEVDSDRFPEIGRAFEKEHSVMKGKLGQADCLMMSQRDIVDFTVKWLQKEKGGQINEFEA
ncbi:MULTISPECIES: aminoglycoside N(3)-acetyltransferase [Bacillaceae]|uniref:Aminoglycoside N(3)-acetyltransferase n=2 Tax=Bacillus infantis TaxID=324767 RepID=U5L5Q5_9BACI|nr:MULTISPECIES: AAC(3) family N-acetyltransferase [Bacillus]OXT16252.1 AAC(3) family N-acetyltransferase [Bacillus sp. OG2]AGX02012.1 aminoglycoside N(3')-acetyltransferase [Bacillus infantis NRRL B-14911]EAR66903.1 Aminoglycoside N3'-acetyltransferase [Bacillus sp. NRRL B-14911]MCA1034826.1 AAC(3) family N-acetyltransferase [Bacillus infantis]MCK6205324.1 AAC(3) family N-acetyltransferase [Bacillus infantis]